jgi:anti-sigma factor RsiW
MSDHVEDLLALGAAGSLTQDEDARVTEHLGECTACGARAEEWHRVATELGRLPEPAPSPGLVARTRAAVERWQAEREERAWNRAALGFVIVFGWTLTGVAWLLLEIFVGELTVRLDRPLGSTAAWFGVYLVAGWVMAGSAAMLLGRRAPEEGRIA